MPPAHCCLLCGCPCVHPNCRYTPLASIKALVRQRCIETAFHYAALMALPEVGRHMICPPCINWRRRSRCHLPPPPRHGRARRRAFTPFDGMLLHALAPGSIEDPDSRCGPRLRTTLLDPANGFAALLPAPIRAVLSAEPADRLRAWWDANDRTPFFRHAGTARAVRQMLRPAPAL